MLRLLFAFFYSKLLFYREMLIFINVGIFYIRATNLSLLIYKLLQKVDWYIFMIFQVSIGEFDEILMRLDSSYIRRVWRKEEVVSKWRLPIQIHDRLFNKTFYLGIDAPVDIFFDGICHQSLTCFCCASQFALTQIGK